MRSPSALVAEADELVTGVYEHPRLTGQAAARLAATAEAAGDLEAAVVATRVVAMAAVYGNRINEALAELVPALRRADRARLTERAGELRVTLAFAQSLAGRQRAAARTLERAVKEVPADQRGRAAQTRAFLLGQAGRVTEALAAFDEAQRLCEKGGDRRGEAIVANNRALLLHASGAVDAAAAELHRAEAIAFDLGDHYVVACAHQNLGVVTGAQGDIPGALAWYDRAEAELALTNAPKADDLIDRAETMLGAGLPGEARALAEAAAAELMAGGTKGTLAEARLLTARAALADGDAIGARDEAEAAQRAFAAQGRRAWGALAAAVALHATWRLVPDDPTLLARARRTADRLAAAGWDAAAADARVLAGRIALNLGRPRAARLALAKAAAHRQQRLELGVAAAHAQALLRLADGDRGGAETAARLGLTLLEERRARLGSVELRSAVAAGGDELARLGLRLALGDADPTRTFEWAERWRAGALRLRPVRPEPGALGHDLAALRSLAVAVERARLEGRPIAELGDRLAAAEAAVQSRTRRTAPADRSPTGEPPGETGPDELSAALDERALVEYVALDGGLAALTLTADEGLKLHPLDAAPDLSAAVDDLRSSLRRLTRARGSAALRGASRAAATASALALQRALVTPLRASIDDRPLVVIPTGTLHALPWAMLPDLRGRPVAVAPSARLWLRAERDANGRRRNRRGRTVLALGPGLPGAANEIDALARLYPSARCLLGAKATAAATAKAIDGAAQAHIACHGSFRADNPLFSALRLADGPLTLYDLETLHRAPSLVVLSACDVGLSGVLPGDELRGLATAFLGLGTNTIVASVTPVPDDVAGALMVAFHQRMSAGSSPAEALATAERDLDTEPGAGGGFVCLGAG